MDRSLNGFRKSLGFTARVGLLAVVLAAGAATAFAQDRYAIDRAQQAVRERIMREQGGSASVTFDSNRRADIYRVSNNQTGVRGEGYFRRDYNSPTQRFTYDAVVNTRSGRVQPINYQLVGTTDDGGYNNDNDNDTDRAPRWLRGTFRGRNPSGRQSQMMSLTIDRSGDVEAVYDNGTRESGRYANGQIQLGNRSAWSVARSGNGFRATARRRSEDFVRTSGDDYADSRGDSGRVPRWMVGTFRGMTDSGESELTIQSDGSASARSLSTGETFYGRYENNTLRFEWGDYEVTRVRDGVRTINRSNRNDTTDYRRVN